MSKIHHERRAERGKGVRRSGIKTHGAAIQRIWTTAEACPNICACARLAWLGSARRSQPTAIPEITRNCGHGPHSIATNPPNRSRARNRARQNGMLPCKNGTGLTWDPLSVPSPTSPRTCKQQHRPHRTWIGLTRARVRAQAGGAPSSAPLSRSRLRASTRSGTSSRASPTRTP